MNIKYLRKPKDSEIYITSLTIMILFYVRLYMCVYILLSSYVNLRRIKCVSLFSHFTWENKNTL